MRTIAWMIGLGLVAGAAALWLLGDQDQGDPSMSLDGSDVGLPAEGTPRSLRVETEPVVIVAEPGAWFPDILHEGEPVTDSRITDVQVVDPDDRSWVLTGDRFLEILEKELGPLHTGVVFPDAESLERFKKGVFPVPVPSRAHLGMLLTNCPDIGFRAVSFGRAIYIAPLPEAPPVPPGADPRPGGLLPGKEPAPSAGEEPDKPGDDDADK
jgi:hypothetical protein